MVYVPGTTLGNADGLSRMYESEEECNPAYRVGSRATEESRVFRYRDEESQFESHGYGGEGSSNQGDVGPRPAAEDRHASRDGHA